MCYTKVNYYEIKPNTLERSIIILLRLHIAQSNSYTHRQSAPIYCKQGIKLCIK